MLQSLAIRDIVLIERLDLQLENGLVALTGETGAGKSILLDALGLALGARADRALIRAGAERASVSAVFVVPATHPAHEILAEAGLDEDDAMTLRRVLTADGKGRAFVNDQPVGTGLLRRLGEALVEVHGQHDQRGLLNARTHLSMLDAYGRLKEDADRLRRSYRIWREAATCQNEAERRLAEARSEEAYLRHRCDELQELAPEVGEEEQLNDARLRLMSREKLAGLIGEGLETLGGPDGVVNRLGGAQRRLERAVDMASDLLGPAAEAVARAQLEACEAEEALHEAMRGLETDSSGLEQVEERLFALRDASRKHRLPIDDLPRLLDETLAALEAIDAGDHAVADATRATVAARQELLKRAAELGRDRRRAAGRLQKAVQAELAPLKLERARFEVVVEALDEDDIGADGGERVAFEVATNPGQPAGALSRIASGGELSRFMLVLKVVLADIGDAPSLIFDEIDTGIGGATADAVGERLAVLGHDRQVLVVTHAPQIAARADHHLRVTKLTNGKKAVVEVSTVAADERREEIARMLAGATITEAARSAADSLMAQAE